MADLRLYRVEWVTLDFDDEVTLVWARSRTVAEGLFLASPSVRVRLNSDAGWGVVNIPRVEGIVSR